MELNIEEVMSASSRNGKSSGECFVLEDNSVVIQTETENEYAYSSLEEAKKEWVIF